MLVRSKVASGPFCGMSYVASSSGSGLGAKLVGSYESELHPIVRSLPNLEVSVYIDIGAAEGYYAVGLLRSDKRDRRVVAFEVEQAARDLCAQLAELNGVSSRLTLLDRCSPEVLATEFEKVPGRACVICDVEGYEAELLDPDQVPGLRSAFILVELHENSVPGVTRLIRERFFSTHLVQEVTAQSRLPSDFPLSCWWTRLLPAGVKLAMMAEHRGYAMAWLWLQPRA